MRVGFTGTQLGMTSAQAQELRLLLGALKPTEFHHGDCIGADAEAAIIADACGSQPAIHTHPPIDPDRRAFVRSDVTYKERPYLARNQDIVNASDVLIAAPRYDHEITRSGTWATVRYARYKGIRIFRLLRRGGHRLEEAKK